MAKIVFRKKLLGFTIAEGEATVSRGVDAITLGYATRRACRELESKGFEILTPEYPK